MRTVRYEVEKVLVEWKGARDRAVSAYEVAREEGAGRIGAAIEAIRAVREPQGREEGASGDEAGRERDEAEKSALERVRAAEDKLKEEEQQEERGDGRNEDDKGLIRVREPQEHRIEQEIRDQVIQPSKDRGWEMER